MKANQLDILIVPGYKGSGPDHWQTRWEKNYRQPAVLNNFIGQSLFVKSGLTKLKPPLQKLKGLL